jgi:hypothetical protein
MPRTRRGAPQNFFRQALSYTGDNCLLWPYSTDHKGYAKVGYQGSLWIAGRLICTLLHGPASRPGMHAAHSCGNRSCVSPRHLRWATPRENEADKLLHGRRTRGDRNGFAKLTIDAVRIIRARPYRLLDELATEFGVSKQTVCKARLHQTWTWVKDCCDGPAEPYCTEEFEEDRPEWED